MNKLKQKHVLERLLLLSYLSVPTKVQQHQDKKVKQIR